MEKFEKWIKLRINKNKANQQINLVPKKTELPKVLKDKIDCSNFLKVKWEDIDFE